LTEAVRFDTKDYSFFPKCMQRQTMGTHFFKYSPATTMFPRDSVYVGFLKYMLEVAEAPRNQTKTFCLVNDNIFFAMI
jgi:hypothetical protein